MSPTDPSLAISLAAVQLFASNPRLATQPYPLKLSSYALEGYGELCEKEFRELTKITFTGSYGHKLAFKDQESSGWNYERLAQLSLIHRQMAQNGGHALLLELYHGNPAFLADQFRQALILSEPRGKAGHDYEDLGLLRENIQKQFEDPDPVLIEALKKPQFLFFLRNFLPVQREEVDRFKALAMTTAGSMVKRLSSSLAFQEYAGLAMIPTDFYPLTGGMTPLFTGLFRVISAQLPLFRDSFGSYIRDANSQSQKRQAAEFGSFENAQSLFDTSPIQFAFAPSGSGKTTSIFNELKTHYGFYMVSCALNKYPQTPKDNPDNSRDMLEPKIPPGVSGDTRELLGMLESAKSSGLIDGIALELTCGDWWNTIIHTRYKVFDWYCEEKGSDGSAEGWLWLQRNCDQFDPFLDMFRMTALLIRPIYGESGLSLPSADGKQEKDKRITRICLDEAQEDLNMTSPFDQLDYPSKSLFDIAMAAMRDSFEWHGTSPRHVQGIIAGTSLNAQKARKARDIGLPSVSNSVRPLEEISTLATSFPLVMSEADARQVLRAYGVETSNLDDAVRHSRPLWGRVKWTAMYAAKIAKLEKTEGDIDSSKIAQDMYATIVKNLRDRLKRLQTRPGGAEVIDRLLEAAISADVLDRDHVFYQEDDLRLVEEGFAIVQSNIDHLKTELKRTFPIVEKSRNRLMVKATGGSNSGGSHDYVDDEIFDDQMANLLFKVQQRGLVFANCDTMLTPKSLTSFRGGFTMVDCTLHMVAESIEKEGFIIVSISTKKLEAKLPDGVRKNGSVTTYRKEELRKVLKHFNKSYNKDHGFKSKFEDAGSTVTITYSPDKETKIKRAKHLLKVADFGGMGVDKGQSTEMSISISKDVPDSDKQQPESCSESHGGLEKVVNTQRGLGLIVVNKTKAQLKQLLVTRFEVADETKPLIVAKLAERVVIDAVIQFSLGQRFDQKIMGHVRLACNTSGLGHIAENYLAVQLHQCFSIPLDNEPARENAGTFEGEWDKRRARIIAALGKAVNACGSEVGDLDDFGLVAGKQTIKDCASGTNFLDTLMHWLDTIRKDQQPPASFLLPHNDFGPDLVFALRNKKDRKKVILCSIQLKLSSGKPDAVNKSSFTWACSDRSGDLKKQQEEKKTCELKLKKLQEWITEIAKDNVAEDKEWDDCVMETVIKAAGVMETKSKNLMNDIEMKLGIQDVNQELKEEFWDKQSRVSLLVIKYNMSEKQAKMRPATPDRDGELDFFACIDKKTTKDVFGVPFMATLKAIRRKD